MYLLGVSSALEAVGGFAVLAIGYGAVFALWRFVFSPRNRHDDDLSGRRPPFGALRPGVDIISARLDGCWKQSRGGHKPALPRYVPDEWSARR